MGRSVPCVLAATQTWQSVATVDTAATKPFFERDETILKRRDFTKAAIPTRIRV